MPAGAPSNLKNFLIKGIPEMEKTIKELSGKELDSIVLSSLNEIGTPTRRALLNYYSNRAGKWDNESLKRALSHRWWSKKRRQGLPVGFSRALAVRALLQDGFGFTVKRLQRSAGYLLKLTAWGPGIHLIEKGRTKGARTYQGWGGALSIMRRFESYAVSRLNEVIPQKLEQAAERIAAQNGMKQ